jgi:hypothetical protein
MLHRLSLLLLTLALASCATGSRPNLSGPQVDARRQQIAAELPGDYYIGRRFHIERTHFWGYLRRPRQPWEDSKLVIFNERVTKAPDRYHEVPSGTGPAYGYDHNREYRIWGRYTGRKLYDPNSNLILPEFELHRFEVQNHSPGWLFDPRERFNGSQLLRTEPSAIPQ